MLFLLLALVAVVSAGNTTCVSGQLDWYTRETGESPCTTYERLRKICGTTYEVGNFFPDTPGDSCDDQVKDCCCNSVAFTLSMLCMNCQQCTDGRGPNCIDAGDTAYTLYQNGCSPPKGNGLPKDVQSAVCRQGIKIPDTLYNIGWDTGAWFYTFARSMIEKNFAANGDGEFSKCPPSSSSAIPSNSGSSSATASPSSPVTPPADEDHSTPIGPIVGGAVGGVVGLAAIGFLAWFLFRRRALRNNKLEPQYDGQEVIPTPWAPPSINQPLMSHDDMSQANLEGFSAPTTISSYTGGTRATLAPPTITSSSSLSKQRERERELVNAGPSSVSDDRHKDGGPIPEEVYLARSASGRLPPSYGGWNDTRA